MPTFPLLKTGAVTQYPAQKSIQYATYVARFLDGTEQRYRERASPLSQWMIRLDLLEDGELSALEAFFADLQGSFGGFSFTDPWDSTTHPNCSLDQDTFDVELVSEGRGRTTLVVRENRT